MFHFCRLLVSQVTKYKHLQIYSQRIVLSANRTKTLSTKLVVPNEYPNFQSNCIFIFQLDWDTTQLTNWFGEVSRNPLNKKHFRFSSTFKSPAWFQASQQTGFRRWRALFISTVLMVSTEVSPSLWLAQLLLHVPTEVLQHREHKVIKGTS